MNSWQVRALLALMMVAGRPCQSRSLQMVAVGPASHGPDGKIVDDRHNVEQSCLAGSIAEQLDCWLLAAVV